VPGSGSPGLGHLALASAPWADDDRSRGEFGGGVSWVVPEKLRFSPEIVGRIHNLQEWFDRSLNWDYPPDPGPWRQDECDRFNLAARELYHAITLRRAVGACTSAAPSFEIPQPYALTCNIPVAPTIAGRTLGEGLS